MFLYILLIEVIVGCCVVAILWGCGSYVFRGFTDKTPVCVTVYRFIFCRYWVWVLCSILLIPIFVVVSLVSILWDSLVTIWRRVRHELGAGVFSLSRLRYRACRVAVSRKLAIRGYMLK